MILLARGDALRLPFADQSLDLVFGSPPYLDKRLYLEEGRDLGISRSCSEWVEWMLAVTTEAARVARGPVLWVVAGGTSKRRYQPGPEGLAWEWFKRGGALECPCFWYRSGISGSGGDQWFRKDVEYVLCFKRALKFPWSDNTAMGHSPKWNPGGAMSHRMPNGRRVAKKATARRADGKMERQGYVPPERANPGNLVRVPVGGGRMGHPLAHRNEAPFPEGLAEHFIRSFVPPGGVVLDPFSGSGTTASVARRLGRKGIGIDLRASQCALAMERASRPYVPGALKNRAGKTERCGGGPLSSA